MPLGYVVLWARLIWYEEPRTEQPELGYLIAALITEMSATDHVLYGEYLERLAAGAIATKNK